MSTVTSWVTSISDAIEDVFDQIIDLLTDAWNGIISAFNAIPFGLGTPIATILSGMLDAAADFFGFADDTRNTLPISGTYSSITATTPPAGTQAQATDIDTTLEYNGSSWDVIHKGTTGGNQIISKPWTTSAITLGAPTYSGGTNLTLNGGSSIAQDYDGVLLEGFAGAGTDRIQGRYFTPSNGSAFGIVALVEYGCLPASQSSAGLMLRDSGGKYLTFGLGYISGTMNLHVHRWNSNTSFNSIVSSTVVNLLTNGGPRLLAVGWSGTVIEFWASYNGREWQLVYSEADNAFLNGAVAQWGYYVYCTIGSASTRLRARASVEISVP